MTYTNPSLTLYFLGNDLPGGHDDTHALDYTDIVNRSIVVSDNRLNGLKSSSSQVTMQLSKDCSAIEDIIATDGDIKAVFKDGTTVLFTGYLSTNFSWTVTDHGEQALNITLEDVGTRLFGKAFISTGRHLFNSLLSTAVSAICAAAGVTVDPNITWTQNPTVTKVVEAGESCKDILQQMLYEAGYVYYFDEQGRLHNMLIDCTTTAGAALIDRTKLYVKNGKAVSVSKKIRSYKSARVQYTSLDTASGYLVYRNTTGADDSHPYCNQVLEAGHYFDGLEDYTAAEWGEATADTFRENAQIEAVNADSEQEIVGSRKIISVSNPSYLFSPIASNLTLSVTAPGGPYLEMLAHNAGSSNKTITRMDIYANIIFEKDNNIIRTAPGALTSADSNSVLEEELVFIHDKASAQRHANLVAEYHKYCNSQYTFYTKQNLSPGSIVELVDDEFSGLDVFVMVVGKKLSYTEVIEYTAIGISVFSLSADVYYQTVDPAGSSSRAPKLVSSVQQYYISTSKDELIGGTWLDEMPQIYTGYVWYRTKYVYSNGTVTYSQYAHYLTTAEIDAPWVLSTMFAVSSSDDWEQADTTQPPVQGVTYYERLLDGSLREADVSEGWTQGVSYYFIPDCSPWSNEIPSSWVHGKYIWSRDTITYTLNGISQRMIPVYSASATSDAERTCKFVVTPSSYTWAKNKRAVSSDNVTVTFGYEIQGYGESVEPLITVPSGYDITVSNNSIQFNSAIALDRMEIFVSLAQFPDVTPVKIVLESVDVTDEPTYLGILTAMPSADNTRFSRFLAGDHFVANGITGKTDLMPYVYDGVNWVAPSRNGVYGPMAYIQILYNCVHDIFSNAQDVYTLCGTGATAQEGISYYQQLDGVWTGIVVRTGEDVSTLYTKGTNVPSQVLEYYNYQAEIISDYVASNDIQLVEQTDPVTGKTKVGKIRSAGYEKGTVKTLIETAQGGQSLASYKQGFYGDTDGNFEAFDAWLYRANIYNANIVGELRNDLFFTNLEAKVGATYTQSTLTNESWSGTKALESVRSAIGSSNVEKILSMGAHYPTQGNQYSLGMLVDNPARAVEASVNAGATFTAPIFTAFTASLPLFNSGNVPVSGGDIYYNATLVNRKRWAISSLYDNTDITANVLNASGISWNGTNLGYARVTNPGATAVNGYSTSHSSGNDSRYDDSWSFTIPNGFRNATMNFSGNRKQGRQTSWFQTLYRQGSMRISINGASSYYIGATENGSVPFSGSLTVNAGDTITVAWGNAAGRTSTTDEVWGSISISIATQTFAAQGMDTTGFYTFTTITQNGYTRVGTATNRNNHPIYYQEDTTDTYYEKAAVTLTSPSWSSANHLLAATVSYTYEKYQTGLNLLNSNGERQQTVTTGAHPVSEYFDVTYGGTVRYKSDTAQHYWHINSAGILTRSATQEEPARQIDSAKIFAIDSCTAYYKLFGDNSRRNITDVTGVIWTNSSIIFETANGNVIVTTSDWVAEFYVNLVSQSQRRGNFADTILPIMSEHDREQQDPVKKINLGAPENRFDAIYSKELGARSTPIEDIYANNGMIKNVNLIPVSVTTFEQGLTYYYFNSNGILTAKTESTPVSGRQYFLLNTDSYGHFDVLSMLDTVDSQRKRLDALYMKLSNIENAISQGSSKVPTSGAVYDAIMNIIPTWNYLGSVSVKGPSLTVPASSIHVLCIIQDTYSEPRTASLDLYPGISKSGYYAIGAYYFNGAGLGSQIKWDGTNRTVSFAVHYTDAKIQDSGVTLYVYYR